MLKRLFMTCLAMLMLPVLSNALPSQTFVSSIGNDANDCTQTTPCRTFAGALPKTGDKGVITALDSSVYGIVTIDRAITLQAAPGVSAILEGGRTDDVVTINAGATAIVALRNLQIITRSLAANKGVLINSVGTLHVEGCMINGFGGAGLSSVDGCSGTGCAQIFVVDSILRDNVIGMKIGSAKALVDHCRIEHNHTGVLIVAQADVAIRDCVLSGNSVVALKAQIFGKALVENCIVTHNGTGIETERLQINNQFAFSEITVSLTTIISNVTGLFPNGGSIYSWANNRLAFNTSNGGFTGQIEKL